jgi:hypothetical protein
MFDFFVELAFDLTHEGLVTPLDNSQPLPWGPHPKI